MIIKKDFNEIKLKEKGITLIALAISTKCVQYI